MTQQTTEKLPEPSESRVPHQETPTLGNPDLPPEGMENTAGDPASAKMAGPRNPVLESQFPNVITAPATDVSTQPFFWSSFNISPRRQQRGGWAREVTQADFANSEEFAGVNMYLEPGGIRELHWHQTAEWAVMTEGKCRVTTLSREGKPSVEDVFKGDLWFFPSGLPHSLQGLGPDGAEFVIAFDNGAQSESNTLLLTDWFAHTRPRCWPRTSGWPRRYSTTFPCTTCGSSPVRNRVIWRRTRSRPASNGAGRSR
jgi:oxalate decarboxylase